MKKNVTKAKKQTTSVQLSLFDTDWREKTDRELIEELTKKPDQVAEEWEYSYSMERLYNQLTPQRRRIAVAAVELYRRRELRVKRTERIRSSVDIVHIMRPYLAHLEIEEFWILPMSQACRVIKPIRVTIGGINQTMVDVRTIMRKLLELSAAAFAVVHNHPSGNIRPSKEDKRLTEAIRDASKLFNIHLLDHVIIGWDEYYSFMDEGEL